MKGMILREDGSGSGAGHGIWGQLLTVDDRTLRASTVSRRPEIACGQSSLPKWAHMAAGLNRARGGGA